MRLPLLKVFALVGALILSACVNAVTYVWSSNVVAGALTNTIDCATVANAWQQNVTDAVRAFYSTPYKFEVSSGCTGTVTAVGDSYTVPYTEWSPGTNTGGTATITLSAIRTDSNPAYGHVVVDSGTVTIGNTVTVDTHAVTLSGTPTVAVENVTGETLAVSGALTGAEAVEFEVTEAAAWWAFGFVSIVAMWLVAWSIGQVVTMINRAR